MLFVFLSDCVYIIWLYIFCIFLVWINNILHRISFSQVIKFTSCLPRVGGSHRVLRLPPPLKLVATIELKSCWKYIVQHQKIKFVFLFTHFIKSGSWRSYTIDHTHKYNVFFNVYTFYKYNIKIHTHNILKIHTMF